MKLLFICTGYLPYTFSENLCNGKLVYALKQSGIQVDVISKKDEGPTYNNIWQAPWLPLKEGTYEITYPTGNKISRSIDIIESCLMLGILPINGIRWAKRAYKKALDLCKTNKYDAILTRSPSDIPHIVGYKIQQQTGIKWIANWNDPASTIWPKPYNHKYSAIKQRIENTFSIKILKAADINTFPSKRLSEHFIRHYPFLKGKNNVIIPHIGLLQNLMPSTSEKTDSSTIRMCHSGNLSKERNPELLFRAINELSAQGYSIELDIMGHINEYTNNLIDKYSLKERVRPIGNHTYIEALQLMSSYDILVLIEAQMEEGIFFPSKLTDYAQLEKPILAISPKNGFAHDVLNEYGGGIAVDNTNIDSIKNGIKALYSEWKGNSLKQNHSSKKLYAQFSPNKIVEIYKSIIP